MNYSFYVPALLPFSRAEPAAYKFIVRAYERLAREKITLELRSIYCEPAIVTVSVLQSLPAKLKRHAHAPFDRASPALPKLWVMFSTRCRPRRNMDLNAPISDQHEDIKIRDVLHTEFQIVFWNTLRLFLIAANIASPGSFRCAHSLMTTEKKFVSYTERFTHELEAVLEYCLENQWPKVEQLSFAAVWRWANRLCGFAEGLSDGKISRALNAFTYLFGDSYSNIEERDLIWSMIGLESLFADNAQGVLHQVAEKSALLIGSPKKQRNLIQDIYNYRSRLLHGDVDIPNKFSELGTDGDERKLFDRSYKANVASCAMLVACLQRLAKRELTDIGFVYRLQTK